MKKIRVLFARNEELWWDGLKLLLTDKSENDIEVVGVCIDAVQTIKTAVVSKPDILLLDEEIASEDSGGIELPIKKALPEIKIVIVIKPHRSYRISSSDEVGLKSYIEKHISFEDIKSLIRYIARGGIVISPIVVKQFLEQSKITEKNGSESINKNKPALSEREIEILNLVAREGKSNQEIARWLFISENTVKAHMSNILEKLQVPNRQRAVTIARERGILPSQESSEKLGMLTTVFSNPSHEDF